MIVLIYVSKVEDLGITKSVINYLESVGVNVYSVRDFEVKEIGVKKLRENTLPNYSIVIGGDGTLLRYIHDISINYLKTPILHIGTGRVNFLSDVSKEEAIEVIKSLVSGDYGIDERDTLQVIINDETCTFLNEVLVKSISLGKVITIIVEEVDGEELINARMDGIIVATPTGSTAYSLSGGGSIIDLRIKAKTITPLAPFSKALTPIIHPLEIPIKITTEENSYIVCDGVKTWISNEVLIRYSEVKIKFVRTRKYKYYNRLRRRILTL